MKPFKKSCIIAAVYLIALSAFLLSLFFCGKTNQGTIIVLLLFGFAFVVLLITDIYEKELTKKDEMIMRLYNRTRR